MRSNNLIWRRKNLFEEILDETFENNTRNLELGAKIRVSNDNDKNFTVMDDKNNPDTWQINCSFGFI